jgi:Methylase involved in ubiquinone/menaquinone biosynthesis
MTSLADGFRDVDATADLRKLIRCLVAIDDLPDFRAYKEASIDGLGLAADARVADVACGLGFDLLRLQRRAAAGLIVGFDASGLLLDNARRTVDGRGNIVLAAADARALPCPDATFDAVRIDRSLQHIENPLTVLSEMARITRRGGLVAASEPDWDSFSLGMGDDPTMRTILQAWLSGFRNPRIGCELPALFEACGLVVRARQAQQTTLTDWSAAVQVYDVPETIRRCVSSGLFDADAAERMTATIVGKSRTGAFRACLTVRSVIGEKR